MQKSTRLHPPPPPPLLHAPLIANNKQIWNYHIWHNSYFRVFSIPEYRKVIRSGIQQIWQRACNKYRSFENDIQLQWGPIVTWWLDLLKVALGKIEIILEIETGGYNLMQPVDCQNSEFKNNFRTSLKRWIFSSTFFSTKKIQGNSRNSRTTEHPESKSI